MSKPTRLDRLRAIERLLLKSDDQTVAIDAALEETRKEIALERASQKAAREKQAPALHPESNRRHLTALVAAGTKLDAASRLAKEATVDIARCGLLPREYVQKIAANIDSYVQRIASAIELIP